MNIEQYAYTSLTLLLHWKQKQTCSLEVIPGDAYKVEKSGDDKSGFVTKVVFTKNKEDLNDDGESELVAEGKNINGEDGKRKKKKNNEEDKKKKRAKRQDDECNKNKSTDDNIDLKPAPTTGNKTGGDDEEGSNNNTATLSKKERQKLKRKAKQKLAKERKRLKREQVESNSNTNNKSVPVASTSSSASSSTHQDTNSNEQSSQTETSQQVSSAALTQLQTTWSIAAPGISLHNTLCQGLHALQYTHPTPIQAATLPAAILGRRDIVGAAPTGSGKTLSYGLPILQYLLDCSNDDNNNASGNKNATVAKNTGSNVKTQEEKLLSSPLPLLQALILTPTRELALQVSSELQKVCCNMIKIGTIVGGFAEVKQRRTLEKVRPPIVVATPGRLWELVSLFVCCFLCALLNAIDLFLCAFSGYMGMWVWGTKKSMKNTLSHGLDSFDWNINNVGEINPNRLHVSQRFLSPIFITLQILSWWLSSVIVVSWKKLNFNMLHCLVVSYSTLLVF